MNFLSENTTRKVDSLGRISIPKSLRDRFEIGPNDEMEFSVCYEGDRIYICMNKRVDLNKMEILAAELEGMGFEVPEDLQKALKTEGRG